MNLFESNLLFVAMVTVLAVVSPGPDFAVIVRNGLRYGRSKGFATALGIAAGVVVHTTYTLLGLSYIITEYSWVLETIRFAGAAYLVWLGFSAFLPKKNDPNEASCPKKVSSISIWGAFRNGFFCNTLNPKAMLFFIALFTQVVSPTASLASKIGICVYISMTHLLWFSLVVFILTDQRTMKVFNRWERKVEKLVGTCLLCLGLKLALDS